MSKPVIAPAASVDGYITSRTPVGADQSGSGFTLSAASAETFDERVSRDLRRATRDGAVTVAPAAGLGDEIVSTHLRSEVIG